VRRGFLERNERGPLARRSAGWGIVWIFGGVAGLDHARFKAGTYRLFGFNLAKPTSDGGLSQCSAGFIFLNLATAHETPCFKSDFVQTGIAVPLWLTGYGIAFRVNGGLDVWLCGCPGAVLGFGLRLRRGKFNFQPVQ
jgi:hypothetical protein